MQGKELKNLPIPEITKEMREIASLSNISEKEVNIFGIYQNKVFYFFDKNLSIIYKFWVDGIETLLFDVRKNKSTKSGIVRKLENEYGYRVKLKIFNLWDVCKDYKLAYKESETDIHCLRDIEDIISVKRKVLRDEERREAFRTEMKKIRNSLPKGIEKTFQRAISDHYLFFDKSNNKAVCSYCHKEYIYSDIGLKEGDVFKCSCHKSLKIRSSKRTLPKNKYTVVAIQKYDYHKLVERFFNITVVYENNIEKVKSYIEFYRYINDYDKNVYTEWQWWYYGNEKCWCPPRKELFCPTGVHYNFYDGLLHKNGLTKELKKAGLENLFKDKKKVESLSKCKEFLKNKNRLSRELRYYDVLCVRPWVEKIFKVGLERLTEFYYTNECTHFEYRDMIIDSSEKELLKMLKINKRQLQEIISLNVDYFQLKAIQTYNTENKGTLPIKEILSLAEFYKGREANAFMYPDKTLLKITKYIKKQMAENDEVVPITYFDYLRMAEKSGLDIKNEKIKFPKDLREAHAELVIAERGKDYSMYYKAIESRIPQMHKKWDFDNGDFLIRAPYSGKEITAEGFYLGHCVNSYVPSVANGKTTILFIRQKSKPDKALATMEINQGKIIQIREKSNKKPRQSIMDFVDTFKKEKMLI